MADDALDSLIDKSLALYTAIGEILSDAGIYDLDRAEACYRLCSLSFEHGSSVLLLAAHKNNTSSASMVRLQFEALVRGMWVWYAATDLAVNKLLAPLSSEAIQAAKNLPSINDMLKAIAKSENTPPMAAVMLEDFRQQLLAELNSFVHAGIFPIKLHELGGTPAVTAKVIKHSNAMMTMAGMMLANLSGDEETMTRMSKIQPRFTDCLPPLIHPSA